MFSAKKTCAGKKVVRWFTVSPGGLSASPSSRARSSADRLSWLAMLRVLLRGGGRVPARALARAPARWLATSPPKKGRAKSAVPKEPKSSPKGSGAKAATSEKEVYQRLTPHEHVLARPGMYIGSPEVVPKSMWLYDDEAQCMVWRSVQFNSGLYKIFDEILVNALDNRQRDPEGTRAIDVEIDEAGRVSVRNDGRGIPVRRHATEEQVTLSLSPSPNP